MGGACCGCVADTSVDWSAAVSAPANQVCKLRMACCWGGGSAVDAWFQGGGAPKHQTNSRLALPPSPDSCFEPTSPIEPSDDFEESASHHACNVSLALDIHSLPCCHAKSAELAMLLLLLLPRCCAMMHGSCGCCQRCTARQGALTTGCAAAGCRVTLCRSVLGCPCRTHFRNGSGSRRLAVSKGSGGAIEGL